MIKGDLSFIDTFWFVFSGDANGKRSFIPWLSPRWFRPILRQSKRDQQNSDPFWATQETLHRFPVPESVKYLNFIDKLEYISLNQRSWLLQRTIPAWWQTDTLQQWANVHSYRYTLAPLPLRWNREFWIVTVYNFILTSGNGHARGNIFWIVGYCYILLAKRQKVEDHTVHTLVSVPGRDLVSV